MAGSWIPRRSLAVVLAGVAALLLAAGAGAQSRRISGSLATDPSLLGGDVLDSRVTPDGLWVVYRAGQDDAARPELYRVRSDGSDPPVRLSGETGPVSEFRIAPDGGRVVYLAAPEGPGFARIFSAPVDAGSAPVELNVSRAPGDRASSPEFTPDSESVVYLRSGELVIVPADGSTAPRLLAPSASSFRLTPDGSRACLLRSEIFGFNSIVSDLFVVDLDGGGDPVLLSGPRVEGGSVLEFRIDASGERAVYRGDVEVRFAFELFSVPIAGGQPPVRLNVPLAFPRRVLDFELASDGSRVVYRADQDQGSVFELYSVPADGGGAPVRLSASGPLGDVEKFAISPDGARVVYGSDQLGQDRLHVVPIDGSSAPRLLGDLYLGDFRIAPGSRRVVFRALRRGTLSAELYSVRIDLPGHATARLAGGGPVLGAPVRLDVPGTSTVVGFEIGPDGDRVAFRAFRNGPRLFGASIDGGVFALADGPVQPDLRFGPDGRRVFYRVDLDGGGTELYGVASDGSEPPVKLNAALDPGLPSGDVQAFVTSPDGTRVVYGADGDTEGVVELYDVPLDVGQPVGRLNGPLVAGGDVRPLDSRFTSDGSRLVYLADQELDERFELYVVSPGAGTPPVKLNQELTGNAYVVRAEIDPSDALVVYLVRRDGPSPVLDLYSVPIQGGRAPVRVNVGDRGVQSDFLISPDGSRIVYRSAPDLYSAPIDGGGSPARMNGENVPGGQVGGYPYDTAFRIGLDGSRVVYVADQEVDERFELYGAPIDGSRPAVRLNGPFQPGSDVFRFELGSAGRVVYLADEEQDGRFQLYSVVDDGRPGTRPRVELAAGASVGDGVFGGVSFLVAPGGDRVVYERTDDAELYSVPIDGSSPPLQLTQNVGVLRSFRFGPDGIHVVYVSWREGGAGANVNRIRSVPVDGSRNPVLLNGALVAGGQVDHESFRISPDGRWVVYRADQDVDERYELYARPIDGSGTSIRLDTPPVPGGDVIGTVPRFAITADSKWVVYGADQDRDEVFELYLSWLPQLP